MPRKVQKTIEEKIAVVDKEIEEMTERKINITTKIKDLETQKQVLIDEQKQLKLAELSGLLDKLNLTPEEAMKKLADMDSTENQEKP